MKCWGGSTRGQLGDGTYVDRLTPTDVVGLTSGITEIYGTEEYSCAVTSSGEAKCWGKNEYQQLGTDDVRHQSVPQTVTSLSGIPLKEVTAGREHTCVVTEAGGVKCWGSNINGSLGNGYEYFTGLPTDAVSLSSGIKTLGAGSLHTCAVTEIGGVKCWGADQINWSLTPINDQSVTDEIVSIEAGESITCMLTRSGGVKCRGDNYDGQLGNGSTDSVYFELANVTGLSIGVTALTVGYHHSCAIMTSGGLKCWGRNDDGQLGNGTTDETTVPVDVVGLNDKVVDVALGWSRSCALLAEGNVKCWGSGNDGLGTPVDIVNLGSNVVAISGKSWSHICALLDDGTVKCWGGNYDGQLGDGSFRYRSYPVAVQELAGPVKQITTGLWHTCALLVDGRLQCWGDDSYGQLGVGRIVNNAVPVTVAKRPFYVKQSVYLPTLVKSTAETKIKISAPLVIDTYIAEGEANDEKSSIEAIWVGHNETGQKQQKSLLKFGLGAVPEGSTITSAVLSLEVAGSTPNDRAINLTVSQVTGYWDGSISWSSFDQKVNDGSLQVQGAHAVSQPISSQQGQTYQFDLQPLVAAWVAEGSSESELSLLLHTTEKSGNHERAFSSKECVPSADDPCGARATLTLSYTFEVP